MGRQIYIHKLRNDLNYIVNMKEWYLGVYKIGDVDRMYKVDLPSYFFFKNGINTISFLFIDKFRYKSFFRHIANNVSKFYKVYSFRM